MLSIWIKVGQRSSHILQVRLEVHQQGDLLTERLGIALQVVAKDSVLSLIPFLHVLKVVVFWTVDYLGVVIEVHSCVSIGQQVSHPVLGGVVHPLLYVHIIGSLRRDPCIGLLNLHLLHLLLHWLHSCCLFHEGFVGLHCQAGNMHLLRYAHSIVDKRMS